MHRHSRRPLLDWVKRGHLAPAQLPEALRLADLPPAPPRWQGLFDRLLLLLGCLCLGAGLIFFVAFNWQALGRLPRLGLVELPLLAMMLVLWRVRLSDGARQGLLCLCALNLGALLAKSPLLWTFSWLLAQLALVLYWRLGLFALFFSFDEEGLAWCLTLLNALLWGLLWGLPARYKVMPAYLPALMAGLGVTLLALLALFDAASAWIWPVWLLWLGAAYGCWHHSFITGLAMGCLSVIVVLLAALGKWMEPDVNGFLLLSLIAIGLSVAASRWLQQQRGHHAANQ
jgi:uncharacterized membrane protein